MKNKALFMVMFLFVTSFLWSRDRPDALRLYRQGKYRQAVDVCKAELHETPKNMDSFVVLCWSLLKLEQYNECLEYARKALNISRYDNRVVQILGEVHYNLGNNIKALKYLEEYVALFPTGNLIEEVYYLMSEVFIRFEEYNHADIALSTALYHESNSAFWWSRLGYIREKAGYQDFAIEAYRRALQLNPNFEAAEEGLERIQRSSRGG